MKFIVGFISEGRFRVRVGDKLSDIFCLENDVPQGSILSVILFLVAINGVRPLVESSVFMNDLSIFITLRNMVTIKCQLQLMLNCLHTGLLTMVFDFCWKMLYPLGNIVRYT